MFEKRAEETEQLDNPECDCRLVNRSHGLMNCVNRFLGGTAAVKGFLRKAASSLPKGQCLNILDIGSGSCDIPAALLQWADKNKIKLRFTCVEREKRILPKMVNTASFNGLLRIIHSDIFKYHPDEQFDYAIASMFFHHLSDEQIPELITHLRPFVRRGIFINDLHRSCLPYFGCMLLLPITGPDVLRDARLSIRKGFRRSDLQPLLERIQGVSVEIQTVYLGRITANIKFEKGI